MGPGQMLALDLQTGDAARERDDRRPAEGAPSLQGVAEEGRALPRVGSHRPVAGRRAHGHATLSVYRKMFNITAEEREEIIRVLARDESEAVGSMGDDTPMPVLSHHTRNLYDYFRQQFAQVTNPPIDPLRESIVMSLQTEIGPECNMFQPQASHAEADRAEFAGALAAQAAADRGAGRAGRAERLHRPAVRPGRRACRPRCSASAARPRPRCATARWCC